MPYYMARGVSTRLGAMPLADTISSEIITNHKTDKFEKLLQTSKLLDETPVPFPGDEGQHRLNWLGDAPFVQVQAFLHDSREKCLNAKRATRGSSTAQEVKALVLHINLSDRTYGSDLSGKKPSLKIEILFNGQLCVCRLISLHDTRSRVKGHHQVFAGTRIDAYAERPWVVLSLGMAPDGGFETNYKSVSVPQRWQDICQALQSEASQRGANQEGEVPPTATFLEALASMQMPDQVHNMQKPGGKVFGTIDVVITAGEGRKMQAGEPLLKEPKRMPDKHYSLTRKRANLAVDSQILHGKQNSSDEERQSPELNANVSSEHQYPANPSGPYQDVFQNSYPSQAPLSLWSPLSDTTRGPSRLGFSTGNLALGNAAPATRSLDAFHANRHGPNYPPHVGGIGVGLQQFGASMLPMPYWSPHEPPQGFGHAQFSLRSENPLEASSRSSTGVQGFASVPYSAQMAPSVASHDGPRWPLMPGSSSGGRLTGSLPPVGLYSVPTKPNRSAVARKKPGPLESKKSASVISLGKLVILGQNKTMLVKRQWDPPKCLEVGLATPVSAECQINVPEITNSPPEAIKHKDTSAVVREPATTAAQPSASSNEKRAQSSLGHARKVLPSSQPNSSTVAPQHAVHNEPLAKSSRRKRGKRDCDSAVDEPRSSLDLKAPHNPRLNQGCVIAYAERQDQDDEQGIVRQTRAERAGHFEEDYVIFATRFFVGEG